MKTISFVIDEDTHKAVKIYAATRGETIKEYILKLVKENMKKAKTEKE